MKCAARVALGVAGGYFLGRTKKMKLALMLAGTAAGRQAGGPAALLGQGGSAALLGQGKKLLEASPELSRLADEVRGRLLEAGKGAALAVAARQVESLTDRVAGRVESSLSNLTAGGRPPTNASQADQDVTDDDAGDEAGRSRGRGGAGHSRGGRRRAGRGHLRSGRRLAHERRCPPRAPLRGRDRCRRARRADDGAEEHSDYLRRPTQR